MIRTGKEEKVKVRKINPIREVQKKKVAAYARVSTLSEEQDESFETQVAYSPH